MTKSHSAQRKFRDLSLTGLICLAGVLCSGTVQAQGLPGFSAYQQPIFQQLSSQVLMEIRGDQRIIRANGIPDHQPGQFPNRGNPNRISVQRYQFRMPLHPEAAEMLTPVGMNRFGVALNGVPFDPAAAEWYQQSPRSGWQYEANSGKINLGLDAHHAHVQPDGGYHYHGMPTGHVTLQNDDPGQMTLIGYAADGFPIYSQQGHATADDLSSPLKELKSSYRLKSGIRPSGPGGRYDGTFVQDYEFVADLGDLDECNGRTGVTGEYPEGTFYYVITVEFPFIPRYFRGTPDDSFMKRGPGPGGRPPGRFGPPPRPPRF